MMLTVMQTIASGDDDFLFSLIVMMMMMMMMMMIKMMMMKKMMMMMMMMMMVMTTICQVCCQRNDAGSPVCLPWLPAVWLLLCHCCILRRFLACQEKAQHEQALAKLERQKREGKKNQRLGVASVFRVSAAAWGFSVCGSGRYPAITLLVTQGAE